MKRSRSHRAVRSAAAQAVGQLEPRVLFAATVLAAPPAQTITVGGTATAVPLGSYFTDTTVPTGDTVVLINTNLPSPNNVIPLELTNAATPQTVAAFLGYISNGEYANNIIHRSVPGFIIQGGGYTSTNPGNQIASTGNIPEESRQGYNGSSGASYAANPAALSNTTGTIAIALSNGPDSGTSEWFINLVDNSSLLDGAGDGGPFTAFGQTIYQGLATADAIAGLPVVNDSGVAAYDSPGSPSLPVLNNLAATGATVASVPVSDYVTLNPAVAANDGLTFGAVSSNTGLVTTSVSGGTLSLTPVAGATGTSNITVSATDLGGGTTTSTFAFTVNAAVVSPTPTPTPTPTVGTISGTVTNDGTAAAGRTVYIDANGNGTLDTGEVSTTTDATGAFSFADVTPGTYQVREVAPNGFTGTAPAAGFVPAVVTAGGAVTAVAFTTTESTGLTPTLVKTTVPAAVVSTTKVKGTVTVSVTNTTTAVDKGTNTVRLYAVPTGVADPAAGTLLATKPLKLNLKASGTVKLALGVKPIVLPPGTYALTTVTTDASGNVVSSTTGFPLTVAAPFITLTAAAGPATPTAIVAGRTVSFTVTVTNSGNINSTGLLTASVGLSADGTTLAVPLTTVKSRPTIKAGGKAVALRFRVKVPAGTAAGTYFPFVSFTQGTAAVTAIGTTTFTVGTAVV